MDSIYIGEDKRNMPTVSIHSKDAPPEVFELREGEVLYDGLERQGLELPHGCLAGSCSTCKVIILEGDENLERPGAVEVDTLRSVYGNNPSIKDKVIRLSCRAKVLGPIQAIPLEL